MVFRCPFAHYVTLLTVPRRLGIRQHEFGVWFLVKRTDHYGGHGQLHADVHQLQALHDRGQ